MTKNKIPISLAKEFGALTDGITVKNGHEKDATDFLKNFVYPKNDQVKQCRPIPKKKQ